MGCKRRVVRIGKALARNMSPALIKFTAETVGLLGDTDWSNGERREIAVGLGKAKARQLGDDAKEVGIRMAVELAVAAVKDGLEALEDLGQDDSGETISEEL